MRRNYFISGFVLFSLCAIIPIDNARGAERFRRTVVKPPDQSQLKPELKTFINDLKIAVIKKDDGFLLNHISPDIIWSFGEDTGLKSFIKEWKLDNNPAKSPVWSELSAVLSPGCAMDNGEAVFPYVFSMFPDDFDATEYCVLTGTGINVREKPDSKSNVLASLDYEVVKRLNEMGSSATEKINGETFPWEKIMTSDGVTGYVYGKYLASPLGLRAVFTEKNKQWYLRVFTAGD